KPKFHCRRQSGMNFGYVTENGVNSNKCLVPHSDTVYAKHRTYRTFKKAPLPPKRNRDASNITL
ncbi:hypothetical protein, partial [Blautia wexlerae]|uniref:hypothetical protein n=1 Tax=Blautia wexlerae TaxID=418240 RepID=UPI0034A52214